MWAGQPPPGPWLSGDPLARGLSLFLPCWEGAGLKVQSVGARSVAAATLTGMTFGATSGWTADAYGSSVLMDGTDDFIDGGSAMGAVVAADTEGSCSLWFQTTGTNACPFYIGPASDSVLFCVRTAGANTLEVIYRPNGADVIRFTVTATGCTSGKPHHLLYSVGAGGNRFYFDGVPLAPSYSAGSSATTGWMSAMVGSMLFQVGRLNILIPGSYFAGRVSNVKVWNRALSAHEAQVDYIDRFAVLAQPRRPRYADFLAAAATAPIGQQWFVPAPLRPAVATPGWTLSQPRYYIDQALVGAQAFEQPRRAVPPQVQLALQPNLVLSVVVAPAPIGVQSFELARPRQAPPGHTWVQQRPFFLVDQPLVGAQAFDVPRVRQRPPGHTWLQARPFYFIDAIAVPPLPSFDWPPSRVTRPMAFQQSPPNLLLSTLQVFPVPPFMPAFPNMSRTSGVAGRLRQIQMTLTKYKTEGDI